MQIIKNGCGRLWFMGRIVKCPCCDLVAKLDHDVDPIDEGALDDSLFVTLRCPECLGEFRITRDSPEPSLCKPRVL